MSRNPSFQHRIGPSRTRTRSAQGIPAGASSPLKTKSRRIVFITRKWAPALGGMETYCLKLTETLQQDHSLDIIALPGRPDQRPPATSSLILFAGTVIIKWLRLGRSHDIVHLADMAIWPFALLRIILSPDARIVLSAHGTDISYSRRGGLRGRAYGAYQRLGARLLRAARVVANSQATANACRQHGWRDVVIVPLASDLASTPSPDFDRNTILFAGRLIPQKGLSWFVENVLPQLPAKLEVQVAGVATDQREALTLDHPRVRFLGPLARSHLAALYSRAMCVIVPNIERATGEFEGFGLVASEAAACGGLVIAARTGGLVSAVIDGETGFLLPPQESSAWVETITQISRWSDKKRNAFLAASGMRAREYFSWARVAEETAAAYPDNEAS
jgi:glycosyltransferase involved in cell wall biosynthesis